jgi:hypothetical protein
LVLLIASYLCCDPFRVIYSYQDLAQSREVATNRDYVSTEIYLRQHDRYCYDSFIFGSSRSLAFSTADWSRCIDSRAAFHYDASMESLYGIVGKLRLLDRKGTHIRNALFVLDSETLGRAGDSQGHLFVKHPSVSGGGWLPFHYIFVKAYFDPSFLLPFAARKGLGWRLPWGPFQDKNTEVDAVSNDICLASVEKEIAADPAAYYRQRERAFAEYRVNGGGAWPQVVGEKQSALLDEMSALLAKHGTDFRIVINPLCDQKRIHSADLAALVGRFGRDKVWDYSGSNAFTRDVKNYYDTSHFRQCVAREILAEMYGQKTAAAHATTAN